MHAPAHHYPSNSPVRQFQRLIAGIGGTCALLGALVLSGWYLHINELIQLRPAMPPMQFNTALCLVMAGLALCAWAGDRVPLAMPVLGGLVATMGGLTICEYLFHTNLGIDQLLFRCYIMTEGLNPGRISPISSFCFVLIGTAFIILSLGGNLRWQALAVGSCASVIISICLVALLGYGFGLPGTYGWGQLTRVAVHTAIGLSLIGSGLFMIAWKLAMHTGEHTPRWLPVPLALGVFTGTLVLYFALDSKQSQEIAQTVRAGAEGVKNQIALRMDARSRSLLRMAKRWEFNGAPTQASWENDAENFVHDFPDMQALEWIDPAHLVRWIVPLAGNQDKLNRDLTLEARRRAAVTEAEREDRPVMTRIVTLFRGGFGFVVYVPIVAQGRSEGLITTVYNAKTCLDRFLPQPVAQDESIRISDGGQVFYERDACPMPSRAKWIVDEKIELHGATWDMQMWPTPALAARLNSPLPQVVFCVGTLGALLLGAVCYFSQRSSRQALETRRANVALQAALDTVKTLQGLLPICCCCKRVRDDTGYWNQIDTYLSNHTNASLSHGYCPECAAKAFEDLGVNVPEEVKVQLAAGRYEKR